MVKIILDRWDASVKQCDTLVNTLSDEQLQREIAPGKNRGIYLLGHLIAVNDHMLPLLDLGAAKHAELDEAFIKSPDKAVSELPSVAELRSMWNTQKEEMKQQFDKLSTENWFERHTSVSEEDFAKEPHRNKLNIVLTRTTHLTYHTGQLVYLK